MNPTLKFTLLLVIGLMLFNAGSADACPTCKYGLHDGVAIGYAISILLMMAMPFLIFGFWTVTIIRLCRKSRSTQQ